MRDYLSGFTGRVIRTYIGSNTEIIVATQPQNSSNPCFTAYYLHTPYVLAKIYTGAEEKEKEMYGGGGVCKVGDPECFFISMTQCDYFKEFSLLTAEEQKLLNKLSRMQTHEVTFV